jgi:hypothetical protein
MTKSTSKHKEKGIAMPYNYWEQTELSSGKIVILFIDGTYAFDWQSVVL